MRRAITGPLTVDRLRPWLDDTALETTPIGDGGPLLTELVIEMLRIGDPLVAVTLDSSIAAPGTFTGDLLTLHGVPARTRGRGRDAFRAERHQLAGALALAQPDVIGAHWTGEYALAAITTGTPTVVTVRDWLPDVVWRMPARAVPHWLVRTSMQRRAIRRADFLVTPSPPLALKVERRFGREPAVIPNGFPDDLFDGKANHLANGAPRLLAVGNGFSRLKNTETLIRAFRMVRDRFSDAALTLVGKDHGAGEKAERWARRRRFDDGVEFRGEIDRCELLALMGASTLLVHPSRSESFGNVLVEAMARGLPVMGGRHSLAVPWILEDGEAGFLTDVTSSSAMAADIIRVLSDPITLERMGSRGRRRAGERFRGSDLAAEYVAILDRVGRSGGAAPRPGRR